MKYITSKSKSSKKTKKHKISGRKRQDFDKAEVDFQIAQAKWALDEHDREAYDAMWFFIQTAVFNLLNKFLENKLPREDIEERSLDITCSIIKMIVKKRQKGLDWRIRKLSSAVYMPCLARFDKRLQFWDSMSYLETDEDSGEMFFQREETEVVNGIICIDGELREWDITN